eukprot:403344189
MEAKTIDINMNNVVLEKEYKSNSSRTNIFNSTKFGGDFTLPEPPQLGPHESKMKRLWRKRGRQILLVMLVIFFIANIFFDFYYMQNDQSNQKNKSSNTNNGHNLGDSAIYEEEQIQDDESPISDIKIKEMVQNLTLLENQLDEKSYIFIGDNSLTTYQEKDVNIATNCCLRSLTQENLDCDENLNCCSNQPHCVARCMNVMNLTFDKCLEDCRISSSEINHNRYYNDRIYKHCFSDTPVADIQITISNLNENCDQACARLSSDLFLTNKSNRLLSPDHNNSNTSFLQNLNDSTTHSLQQPQQSLQLRCDPRYMSQVNTCDILQQNFKCSSCSIDFNSFAPSLKLPTSTLKIYNERLKKHILDGEDVQDYPTSRFIQETNKVDKNGSQLQQQSDSQYDLEQLLLSGECHVSSYKMLFNCDNQSAEHRRICPCIKSQHKIVNNCHSNGGANSNSIDNANDSESQNNL